MQPVLTFGHEMFSSSATMPAAPPSARGELHVVVDREAADRDDERASERDQLGQHLATNASTPGFASPIELSSPDGVSATRGGGLPSRGSGVIVLVTSAATSTVHRHARRRGPRADRACRTRSSPDARARPRRPGCSSRQAPSASRRRRAPRGTGARADRPSRTAQPWHDAVAAGHRRLERDLARDAGQRAQAAATARTSPVGPAASTEVASLERARSRRVVMRSRLDHARSARRPARASRPRRAASLRKPASSTAPGQRARPGARAALRRTRRRRAADARPPP